MPSLILKPKREKSIHQRHPWVFSGAVARVEGQPQPGETVTVISADGQPLAQAAYSPASSLRARIWTWDPDELVTPDFVRARLQQACQRRAGLDNHPRAAYRLVHGESDGLPGLIADRYRDVIVIQCLSPGAEFWRDVIAGYFVSLPGVSTVFERSDVDARTREGLPPQAGIVQGAPPPARVEIAENGLRFWVDVQHGQKTGFYLDQRPNRPGVREAAPGRDVLDCFAYTGAFTVAALAGGAASVTAIDSSAEALALARENVALNGLAGEAVAWRVGDVFRELRAFRDRGRTFDLIVLDPPKLAPTAAHAPRAARAYKDLNLLALKLLRPAGLLFTFSCSGGVEEALFQKIVAGAALDAQVDAQIVGKMSQGADHPVALNFPEGAYLKGLVVRKL